MKTVEAILQEAIQRGDFNDLPGRGMPVDLTDYFNTPEDLRLAYSILKNADVLPEEAGLLKEIATLKEELVNGADDACHKRLRHAIEDRLLKFNVMMESRKSKSQ